MTIKGGMKMSKIILKAKDATKIFYYLMAADGNVSIAELDKFAEIGKEIDPNYFLNYKNDVIDECKRQLENVIDPEDYYDVVKEGITEVLSEDDPFSINFRIGTRYVESPTLIWNLLIIAFSDGEYSQNERYLIKYIVRKLKIDKTFFLELENSIKTIEKINTEIKWIKNTNNSSQIIEDTIDELDERKYIIFQSVKLLIQEQGE